MFAVAGEIVTYVHLEAAYGGLHIYVLLEATYGALHVPLDLILNQFVLSQACYKGGNHIIHNVYVTISPATAKICTNL